MADVQSDIQNTSQNTRQTANPKLRQAFRSVSVQLEQLVKTFGEQRAVDGVDLDIAPGSLVTLLGPSGCGKTTILRMIAGLERPSSGRVWIDGEDVTRQPAYLRDVTMMFQSYALFPHMTVFENIAYGLRVQRLPEAEIRSRVHDALALVGLDNLGERASNALSGGQQQRVALARALVIQPKVLLFDEPLSNLDAKLRKRVREDIRHLQQDLNITSIYVTHDQEEALAISDVIVLVNKGRIEQQSTPQELYSRPVSQFAANFVGAANFVPGHYDGTHVTVGSYRFAHEQAIDTGEVTVMVRPEAIELSPADDTDAGLAARVQQVAYLGSVSEYSLESELGRLEASLFGEGDQRAQQGQPVQVTFKAAGVYLLPPR